MDPIKFNEISNDIFALCQSTLTDKARDYSDNDDRLSSFYTIADISGEDVYSVWKIFFLKHLAAIFLYIKKKKEVGDVEVTEDLDHRIIDSINYLVLLRVIVADLEEVC